MSQYDPSLKLLLTICLVYNKTKVPPINGILDLEHSYVLNYRNIFYLICTCYITQYFNWYLLCLCLGWDLSYDPAIVTSGQITDTNNLLDEPHWMTSIHQLTEEPQQQTGGNPNAKFLAPNPAAMMGLNSNPAAVAPAPPPGFQNHSIRAAPLQPYQQHIN